MQFLQEGVQYDMNSYFTYIHAYYVPISKGTSSLIH